MSAVRMAAAELRRITAGRLPRLAVVAMLCIPVLYGGLYLYANHDPYGRLDQVPAAVVNLDAGAEVDGEHVSVGADVTDQLLEGGALDWHQVSAAQAARGVQDGRYDVALTLPEDFSAALTSSQRAVDGGAAARQASLTLTTNDATNYLARTIANTVTDRVRDSVAAQVGQQAADSFLVGFSDVHTQLAKAADGADRLAAGAQQAQDGADRLADGAGQLSAGQQRLLAGATRLDSATAQASSGAARLSTGAGRLSDGLGALDGATRTLPADSQRLADGAAQVAQGNQQIAEVGDQVAGAAQDVVDSWDARSQTLLERLRAQGLTDAQLAAVAAQVVALRAPATDLNAQVQQQSRQLDRLATGADAVATGTAELAEQAPALRSGIARAAAGADQLDRGAGELADGTAQLHDGADQLVRGQRTAADGAAGLATGAASLRTGLGSLADGSGTLAGSLRGGLDDVPNLSADARSQTAKTIADPVAVDRHSDAEAASYGAGLAPFFLALACWIGGYVLFLLVRPLSKRAMATNQSPWRVALAGWITPAVLGATQASLLLSVVAFALHITPAHPVATWALLALTSVTFIAIIQALNAWLGAVGQFLGLVLMVLQLVSGGGTFPWQTLPGPLQVLHHVLPMSDAIDGLRHLVYGGVPSAALHDAGVLALWLVGALALTSLAAWRQRVWTVSRITPELVL